MADRCRATSQHEKGVGRTVTGVFQAEEHHIAGMLVPPFTPQWKSQVLSYLWAAREKGKWAGLLFQLQPSGQEALHTLTTSAAFCQQ